MEVDAYLGLHELTESTDLETVSDRFPQRRWQPGQTHRTIFSAKCASRDLLFVESTVQFNAKPCVACVVVRRQCCFVCNYSNPKQRTTPVPCNTTSELHSSNPLMSRDTRGAWARGGFMNCATQTGQKSSILLYFLFAFPPTALNSGPRQREREKRGGDGDREEQRKYSWFTGLNVSQCSLFLRISLISIECL